MSKELEVAIEAHNNTYKYLTNTLDTHNKLMKSMSISLRLTRVALSDLTEEVDRANDELLTLRGELNILKRRTSLLYRVLNFLRGK